MPLTTLSDLERRLRKLEMLYDQDRHKISPPDRNVNTSHPLDVQIAAKAADSELLDGIDSTGFVQTSGNQTIGGVKTFSSLPTLPTGIPTANQPVRKGYADLAYLSILATAQNSDKLDGIDSTGFVQTSGNQTVGGIKTFTSIPVLPATNPTTANQAVRKSYVDNNTKGVYVAITPVNLRDNSGIPIGVYTVYAPTYGVPLTATAVVLRLSGRWTTVPAYQNYLTVRATPTAPTGDENVMVIRPQVSNLYNEGMAICGLSSGYFYYEVAGEAAGTYSAVIICGYFR